MFCPSLSKIRLQRHYRAAGLNKVFNDNNSDSTLTRDSNVLNYSLIINETGLTPLYVAAFNGKYVDTKALLKGGANLKGSKVDNFTTLHYAAMQLNISFISRLLYTNKPNFKAFYKHPNYSLLIKPFNKKIF